MKNIILILTASLSGIFTAAQAQKLPSEQKAGLRAPKTVKVDGKATEWDKFQAYSNHTQFAYTMANDDNYLYLAIQATDPVIIRKIINGGITLTINRSGKKNDKDGVQITYPLLPDFDVRPKDLGPRNKNAEPVPGADSIMDATNKRMGEKSKEIRVTGIKDVDTLISVYNTDGIKAAAAFDNKMIYTYELAVSLKNLQLNVSDPVKFIYQVKVNEPAPKNLMMAKNGGGGGFMTIVITGSGGAMDQAATDFWGEYMLVK